MYEGVCSVCSMSSSLSVLFRGEGLREGPVVKTNSEDWEVEKILVSVIGHGDLDTKH